MGRRKRSRSMSPRRRSRSKSPARDLKRHKKRKSRKEESNSRSRSPSRDKIPRKDRSSGNSRSPSPDGGSRQNNSSKSSDFSSNAEGAAGTESLSIEETNKLRAKLGLAPLECDDAPKQTTKTVDGKNQTVLADGVVWAPASSITAEKKSEKIREKLAVLKETRELERSRMKHKQLISNDDDDDDISSWVQRSRKMERKKLEEKIEEQKMEAVSEEFGVDNLLKEVSKKSQYSSSSLGGLKVEHSIDRFVEGEATILTLKDKKILDEDEEDILVNVNIVDHEKYQRNVENKRKGADYQAFEEEFDEFGMPKMTSLLGKYDEVIEGENKRSFRIGLHGEIDDEEARYRQLVKKELESKTVSLKLPESKIASEYNTKEEEMAKFSKRKRKVKKVRSVLTAHDLLKSMADDPDKDRGSRMNGKREHMESVDMDMDIDDFPPPLPVSSSSIRLDDDVKIDSHLQKTKMISESLTKKSDAAKSIAEKLRRAAATIKEEPVESKPKQLVFDNTAEFCRAVSELNKQDPVKKEPAESFSIKTQLDKELEDFAMRDVDDEEEEAKNDSSGWDRVKEEIRTERESTQSASSSKLKSVLAEEPEVSTGVMGALLMARHKGYLEKEGGKRTMGPVTQNTSKTLPEYAIEDKSAKHIEDKWSRKEDRDKTSLREFKDTTTYKPSFNLEYFDGTGRKLDEKEAFRELSHKFHGKGSGKLKTFKRMKKLEEERKLKGMASDDTPLHMVATMREKQKSLGAAFIVLSGAGQNLASSGTDFKK